MIGAVVQKQNLTQLEAEVGRMLREAGRNPF